MGKKKMNVANGSQRVKISKEEQAEGKKAIKIVIGCIVVAAVAFIVLGLYM